MNKKTTLPIACQWAIYFFESGFKVIPVKGKVPTVKGWQSTGHFKTEQEIKSCWENNPSLNYGIVTEDLVVVDIDERSGGIKSYNDYIVPLIEGVQTLCVRTGSSNNSFHLYFRSNNHSVKSLTGLYPGVDIKAKGGFVVGAGSLHESGNQYIIRNSGSNDKQEIRIADLPSEIIELLSQNSMHDTSKVERGAHIIFNDPIPKGQRNSTLLSYAGKLRAKGLSSDQVHVLIQDANNRLCSPPLDQKELLKISQYVGVKPIRSQELETPIPLYRDLSPPKQFPVDALGKTLSDVTHLLIKVIQAPTALCASSVLASAALACQGIADISIDGRVYPLSLFLITVGSSGERKTGVDKQVLKPHHDIEHSELAIFKKARVNFEQELELYQQSRKRFIGKNKNSTLSQMYKEIGEPPEAPLAPFRIVQEPTFEGIVKQLSSGYPALGLFSDEGGRFFGGYGMSKDQELKTSSGLSSLWDGSEISRSRGEEGTMKIYGKRLSLHLMIQPNIAEATFSNELLIGQGFLSRCLISFPESNIGNRKYFQVNLQEDQFYRTYQARITEIISQPLQLKNETKNELAPRKISLQNEAKSIWINFHNSIELRQQQSGDLANIRGFASKAPENVLRLAGILQLIEDPNSNSIRSEQLNCSIEVMEFYLNEAKRLFESQAIDNDLKMARTLLEWIHSKKLDLVYPALIYQTGPNSIRDAKLTKKILGILEAHHWIHKIEGGELIDGSLKKDVWRVINEKK